MKKYLLILCIGFSVSCTNTKEQSNVNIYDFSLSKVIDNHIADLKKSKVSADKILFNHKSFEKIPQDETSLYTSLISLKIYDINKPALKNVYSKYVFKNFVEYRTYNEKTPLKLMRIYGDLQNPSRIYVYYNVSNNLYTSRHIVNWDLNNSLSIYRLQDIKGLSPDSILIKSIYSNNSKASSTVDTGN